MNTYTRRWCGLLLVVLAQLAGVLACEGNVKNLTVNGTPKYVCPSATPRPTDTPRPTSPPTFPAAFQANLDYNFIHPGRTLVHLQYLAQNVGMVYLSYAITYPAGYVYTSPLIPLTNTGNFAGIQASYPLYLPPEISYAQLTLYSSFPMPTFTVGVYPFPYYTNPMAPPCCLPPPLYPTLSPTFTPYPTPTAFEIAAPTAFFLDDPVYNRAPPVQLRLRLKSPIREGLLQFIIPLLAAATWTLEISNVGQVEYDFLGAGYTFIAEVRDNGVNYTGVWPPSHEAATFLGITTQAYGPRAIQPGQTVTIEVAAWIPANAHVSQVGMLLNPYQSGDPGWATFTPGSGKEGTVIRWTNAVNTICKGEITYP